MARAGRILGQALFYAAFAALIAAFADGPAWQHLAPGQAEIKLSMSVVGERIRPCRRYSAEELAALPPNMRRPADCPRERIPVVVELVVDGKVLYHADHEAAGLWKDGPAKVYGRFQVGAGEHEVTVRVRTGADTARWNYAMTRQVRLRESQNLVVDFRQKVGELSIG